WSGRATRTRWCCGRRTRCTRRAYRAR
ncbi:LOW QUALITY PROTEIN: amidase, partial [Streptomyces pristinaespiralis ATCC 25486]